MIQGKCQTDNKQTAIFQKFYKPKTAWAVNKNFRTNRNFVGKHVKVFAQAENVLGNALKSSNELKVRWAKR